MGISIGSGGAAADAGSAGASLAIGSMLDAQVAAVASADAGALFGSIGLGVNASALA